MSSIFSGIALLYVAATTSAIWASLTHSPVARRRLLLLAWMLTAWELVGTGFIFWVVAGMGPGSVTPDGGIPIGRFMKVISVPFCIILLAPTLCSAFGRATKKAPIQSPDPTRFARGSS